MVLLSEILGQNPVVRALQRAVTYDRLPNAYLFEGPGGTGKEATALALAKAKLCPEVSGRGCGQCSVCKRIDGGLHPDVRIFRPRNEGARNLPVETLRQDILPIAQYAPFEAQASLLIFPEADVSFPEQHPEAANALLKTLEEPRPKVCFVLLSERPDRLLVTIRSRCQRLRFARLAQGVLERILEGAEIPQEHWEAALAMAGGRADRALTFARDGFANTLLEQAIRIDQRVERGEPGKLVELSEELAKRDDLSLVLETLTLFYRDVAASALELAPHQLHFRARKDVVEGCAKRIGARRAAARAQKLAELPELFSRNANPQITLDHLLFELQRAS